MAAHAHPQAHGRAARGRLIFAALLLPALFGCEEPPPKQALGEKCSMAHGEYDRCKSPFYCSEPRGIENLFRSKNGAIGTCRAYLEEGAGCARAAAECAPGLKCEKRSGVCRNIDDVSTEARGSDSREVL